LRPDSADDGITPGAGLALALGEQLAHQVLQRVDDGAEWHIALQLVELAGNEVAVLLAERHAQLLHQRGLADAAGPTTPRARRQPAAARRSAIDNAWHLATATVEL
jgi:nicotinate-nucleotide pyrophosphorylase